MASLPAVARLLRALLPFALLLLAGCGATISHPIGSNNAVAPTPLTPISVSIPVLPNEDLAGPCFYDLLLQQPTQPQRGVLVIFDRADSADIFLDPSVQAAALSMQYAMVFAHQCNATSSGDLQANASKGPARTLLAALTAFASQTSRPELASAPMMLYGFSAAGVLSASLADQAPQRVIAIVTYAANDAYTDLDLVDAAPAAGIPALILANAADNVAGTTKSSNYFQRGRALSAPWSFGVQNATDHCCNLSTQNILIPFMEAVAAAQPAPQSAATSPSPYPTATYGRFICTPDGIVDENGATDCAFTSASRGPLTTPAQSGWLPDTATAAAWLIWVTNPQTN